MTSFNITTSSPFLFSPQHMHEAVELKQQLQIEHEQALVALHTKQKEINQLQMVWHMDKRNQQIFLLEMQFVSTFHVLIA